MILLEPKTEQGYAIVSGLISKYYRSAKDISPERINQREFGIGDFETKIRFRHLSFLSDFEFKEYLIKNSPPYVSCSTAFYKYPTYRPMENKQWLGSELVFDLDATDMKLNCSVIHGTSWVCEKCLSSVKDEAIKLIEEFLIPDFGFSEKEILPNFSGNRGYHIHIKNESVLQLDGNARKELSDYISGYGIEFSDFFKMEEFRRESGRIGKKLVGPKSSDKGWGGKIARKFIHELEKGPESLENIVAEKKLAKNLYKKKLLIEMGINNGNWDMVYIKNKEAFWSDVIKKQAVLQSDKIDKNVTNDPSHMVRLPNTIHGETGLISKSLSISELKRFDPMKDAIAFKDGSIDVIANTTQQLIINGESFGPYDNQKLTLPIYAGIYLFLKNMAKVVE